MRSAEVNKAKQVVKIPEPKSTKIRRNNGEGIMYRMTIEPVGKSEAKTSVMLAENLSTTSSS